MLQRWTVLFLDSVKMYEKTDAKGCVVQHVLLYFETRDKICSTNEIFRSKISIMPRVATPNTNGSQSASQKNKNKTDALPVKKGKNVHVC